MSTLKYTEDHEWVQVEGDVATVGITQHAQDALGDVVFVELPEVGANLTAGQQAGVVESVKAASDIYAPIAGEVFAVNDALSDNPELVNADPYANWFFKLKPSAVSDLEQLLDATAYQASADA